MLSWLPVSAVAIVRHSLTDLASASVRVLVLCLDRVVRDVNVLSFVLPLPAGRSCSVPVLLLLLLLLGSRVFVGVVRCCVALERGDESERGESYPPRLVSSVFFSSEEEDGYLLCTTCSCCWYCCCCRCCVRSEQARARYSERIRTLYGLFVLFWSGTTYHQRSLGFRDLFSFCALGRSECRLENLHSMSFVSFSLEHLSPLLGSFASRA